MKAIVPGSSSRSLARALSEATGIEVADPEIRRFPDGEIYVRVDPSLDKALVVSNTWPNDSLIETLLLLDAVKNVGAEAWAIIPYLGYGRQDRAFLPGEAVSARVVVEAISRRADMVVLVDPHSYLDVGYFEVKTLTATAFPGIAEKFKEEGVDLVLAPDKGRAREAASVARMVGVESAYLEKRRIDATTVEMTGDVDFSGKVVCILDDIISTGGTIAKAASMAREGGAKRVVVGCVHGLFVSNARERILPLVDRLFSSDTVESEFTSFSAAPYIARVLEVV
jgi:ribose-phosphate pyrophosphokinase